MIEKCLLCDIEMNNLGLVVTDRKVSTGYLIYSVLFQCPKCKEIVLVKQGI